MTGLEPATPRLEVWCAIQLRYTDKKVSPGFEPGSVGSKPKVLTITPRNHLTGVTRTPDQWIYSPLLCQLSYSENISSCWVRTSDLSVNSRALCQLS